LLVCFLYIFILDSCSFPVSRFVDMDMQFSDADIGLLITFIVIRYSAVSANKHNVQKYYAHKHANIR